MLICVTTECPTSHLGRVPGAIELADRHPSLPRPRRKYLWLSEVSLEDEVSFQVTGSTGSKTKQSGSEGGASKQFFFFSGGKDIFKNLFFPLVVVLGFFVCLLFVFERHWFCSAAQTGSSKFPTLGFLSLSSLIYSSDSSDGSKPGLELGTFGSAVGSLNH